MSAAALSMQGPSTADWGVIGLALKPVTTTAAITPGTSLAGSSSNTVSSLTVSMTLEAVSVSASSYLLAFVMGDSVTDKITGVTYAGTPMTQLTSLFPGSNVGWLYLYGLSTSVTGGNNIVVSASGSCSHIGLEAQSYKNCATSQPDFLTKAAFSGVQIAWSVIVPQPTTAGCWGVSFFRYSVTGVPITQTATGCGTVASLRVSQNNSSGDLGSIVDTNGTIPNLQPTTLNPNSAQWLVQRADVARRREEKLT